MINSSVPSFPFCAFVGQEEARKLLTLILINPSIGGLLITGEKGTGKSTLIRSISSLLPQQKFIKGCVFHLTESQRWFCRYCKEFPSIPKTCTPQQIEIRSPYFINLPLNITEDNLCGSIHLEKTLIEGKRCLQPGILAKVNKGILYIDEVNLLEEHITHLLLDVSVSEINQIRREGICVSHPSSFILIGSMNPEEGELSPEFLDRFGLSIEISALKDPQARIEVLKRIEDMEKGKKKFLKDYDLIQKKLQQKIKRARYLLKEVRCAGALYSLICTLCREKNVAGHRADIVLMEAAKAMAALQGRREVIQEDILSLLPYVLAHRKRNPSPPPPPSSKNSKDHDQKEKDNSSADSNSKDSQNRPNHHHPLSSSSQEEKPLSSHNQKKQEIFPIGDPFKPKTILSSPLDNKTRPPRGKRSPSKIRCNRGQYIRASNNIYANDIALDATIRSAAPYQHLRKKEHRRHLKIIIHKGDLKGKVRKKKVANLIVFVLDTSGSMGVEGRMRATKGAILSLLMDTYQKRDKVALITFNRCYAHLILPPTNSVELAVKLLRTLPVGGRTPLSLALLKTHNLLSNQLRREPELRPLVIFITDGRANLPMGIGAAEDEVANLCIQLGHDFTQGQFIIIDTERPGPLNFGMCKKWAKLMGAHYLKVEELRGESLINLTKENI